MTHVKTIRKTWRDQHPRNGVPSPTFDEELAEYLTAEYLAGYTLDRIEWRVEAARERGMRALVDAVVITRRREEEHGLSQELNAHAPTVRQNSSLLTEAGNLEA